ncbi:MAG: hypothetical protein DMF86_20815 [Acidobacteria bacterium]|nr:MAG: hypothetical protein DMF86_20815 [Acidobacteriota bacterium]
MARRERCARRPVPRRARRWGTASASGCLPSGGRGRRRRHRGVRHGHRSVGRAVRRPRRRTAVARALPAGVGACRTRRPRSGVRADLLRRRHPEVACDARAQRRVDLGERYAAGDCAACDYCLGELEAVSEPVAVARKILSCVARVGQRFGGGHVANVLCGSDSDQVAARGHQRLSTFGLLKEATVAEVRGYIEQLLAEDLLRQTGDEYPVLALTPAGVDLLKDPGARPDLALARQRRPQKDRVPKRSRGEVESWRDVDRDLFERLRALRLAIARSRGVPPYVIFHDTTLREIARVKPTSVDALRGVYGIGATKAEAFGPQVVAAVVGHG